MSSSNDKPQTQTNMPFSPSHVSGVLERAEQLYGSKRGALAPLNDQTRLALDETMRIAGNGVQGLGDAKNFASSMIQNNGMTQDLRDVQGGIRGALDQANTYFTPFANGSMQEDPRLAAMLETNANRAANAAATRFGSGRYGSAAIGSGVGTAVADANNATMLQSNENARNRQLQAAGQLAGIQMQGQGLLGQIADSGRAAAFQATSALPMLDNLGYSGAERIAGVGDFYQNRAQTQWDWPRTKFGDYAQTVQAMSGLGGTTTKPSSGKSTAQGAIGGAAAGASLGSAFGPWGTLIGAAGGGLLGAWG